VVEVRSYDGAAGKPEEDRLNANDRPSCWPFGGGVPIEAVVVTQPKAIRLRYPSRCVSCDSELRRGTEALWDYESKRATCLSCVGRENDPPEVQVPADLFDLPSKEIVAPAAESVAGLAEAVEEIDRGIAGGSAAREWKRRRERREREILARWGRLGGIALALSEDPHSTNAWAYGANGEAKLGKLLDRLHAEGMGVLHDRRIPGSRANIDHLVVAPWGVFVIDAKNYKGRVERRDRGGFFSTDYRLYVGGRDKTALIAGLDKQVDAVRAALQPEFADVSVCKALCFVDADWSLFANPIELGGAHVLWPRALGKLVRTEGSLSEEQITAIERQLARMLPGA
jgi:hypothetical protein